jgi:hypothetical protein
VNGAGDLGQTYDSANTLEHYLQSYGQTVLFVGDLAYQDDYPFHYQVRYDTWSRFLERSAAYQPFIWTSGNHELDFAPELVSSLILGYHMVLSLITRGLLTDETHVIILRMRPFRSSPSTTDSPHLTGRPTARHPSGTPSDVDQPPSSSSHPTPLTVLNPSHITFTHTSFMSLPLGNKCAPITCL